MFRKKIKKDLSFGSAKKPKIPKGLMNPSELQKYVFGQEIPTFSIDYIKHVWKTNFRANKVLLIQMYLRNGKRTQFLVTPTKPIFEYAGGCYIIDPDYIVEELGSGYKSLTFHQDISIPLNIKMDKNSIMEAIADEEGIEDIVENVNPITLRSVVHSSVIQKVMAGGELEGTFKTLLYVCVGNLVGLFILVLVLGFTLL